MKWIIASLLFVVNIAYAQDINKYQSINESLNKSGKPTNKVVLSKDVKYDQLNPARGDKSPMAGDIWGDRKDTIASGFLLKFADNFSSPPHIHNITYRAIVINGMAHNGDPNAQIMWMPSGSFWIQPAGEPHITSAKGKGVTSYVEIDKGPYLVMPTKDEFNNNERPINIDASNVVWLDNKESKMINNGNSKIGYLWKSKNNDGIKGFLLKLPPNFNGQIESLGKVFHAVIINGKINYEMPQNGRIELLDPGSSFSSSGKSIHKISNSDNKNVTIYVRTDNDINVKED